MKKVFLVTTRITVEDPAALYEQAHKLVQDTAVQVKDGIEIQWIPDEDEIEEIIGTRHDPDLAECLLVLMATDPETIEGCEVDESVIQAAGPKLVSSNP
jgi:hypothetical protein